MTSANASRITINRTESGFVIHVNGKGTMLHSRSLHEFAISSLEDDELSLWIDLSRCNYLDSTFLGCLIDLHKRFGFGDTGRFCLAVPSKKCMELIVEMRLNSFLKICDAVPEVIGEPEVMPLVDMSTKEFRRHVLDCHRHLAEIKGPHQEEFSHLVDRLTDEIEDS